MGVCPAASDRSFDGVNRGKSAGRICWAVTGTLCGGKVQGTFAEKRCSCVDCDFFNLVRAEEGTANLRTKFLRFVSYDTESPLFKSMTYRHVRAGERFIRQGETGDEAYIIELVAARFDSGRPVADRRIGKYVATDIIGRGAYSIVYKGKHIHLDMPVVIKMMRHDLAMNPERPSWTCIDLDE